MQRIRDSIKNDCFPAFVRSFVRNYYVKNKTINKESLENDKQMESEKNIPDWVINSLKAVNIDLLED
jgi:hypothetical protein